MDISKQLHEYEVEYHVLQEEMTSTRPEHEQLKKLQLENQRLTDQNLALIEQLEVGFYRAEEQRSAKMYSPIVFGSLEHYWPILVFQHLWLIVKGIFKIFIGYNFSQNQFNAIQFL